LPFFISAKQQNCRIAAGALLYKGEEKKNETEGKKRKD